MAYRTLSASVRAASLTLTSSLVTVLGTASTDNANSTTGAIKLGDLSVVRLQCTYTSAAGSTTGRPIFAFDVSMDSPDTDAGSVSHWVPVYLIDASAFPGTLYVNGYAYEFSPRRPSRVVARRTRAPSAFRLSTFARRSGFVCALRMWTASHLEPSLS